MDIIFHGQWAQDQYLYNNFFKDYAKNPFLIDVGAGEGIESSNTYIFEKYFGWDGLLFEPQEHFFKLLQVQRPNMTCINQAIYSSEGEAEMIGFSFTSGLTEYMSEGLKKYFKDIWPTAPWVKNYSKDLNPRMVSTSPLHKLLSEVEYVDLLCIDVEGGELEVLKTFNWSIPVYIICIELVSGVMFPLSQKDKELEALTRKFLKEKGFSFNQRLGLDEIWINLLNRRK